MIKRLAIGRNSQNDIVLSDPSVSSFHATISYESNPLELTRFEIIDNNSTNGTFVNGKKVIKCFVTENDEIKVGNSVLNWQNHIDFERGTISNIIDTKTIGRSDKCNIIINRPNVSSVHAKLIRTKEGHVYIVDNKSSNGTYVNNERVDQKQLDKGDIITLSKQHLVNWESNVDLPVINSKVSTSSEHKNSFKYIFIAASIIMLLGIAAVMYKMQQPFDPSQDYNNSVVLIYHSYVYEVVAGDSIMYVTKDEKDNLVFYDNTIHSPIRITGTGFIVSGDGKIITNRHVALPWEYDDDVVTFIKKAIQFSITENVASKEDLMWAVTNVSNVKVGGKSIYLGVGYSDTFVNSVSDFHECIFRKDSGIKEIDVACIQLKSRELPPRVEKYINLEEAITDYHLLKSGDEVYMLGYPAGSKVGDTKDGLKVNFQSGYLTREADEVHVGHNIPTIGGGSGSPIYDNRGRLVAVNHAGLSNTQGFNFAIIAKHAVALIK